MPPQNHDIHTASPSESANHLQAKHLREMLLGQCEQLDADLANYGSALERYQRRGEQTQARRVRGLIRTAERERRSVHQLTAALEERFLRSDTKPVEPTRYSGATGSPARNGVQVRPYPTPHRVIRA